MLTVEEHPLANTLGGARLEDSSDGSILDVLLSEDLCADDVARS